MSHTIYEIENPRTIVFQANADYDTRVEMAAVMEALMALLETCTEPVFHIVDLSRVPPVDFSRMIEGANAAARGPNPVLHHPMIRKVIYITGDDLIKAALHGMDSEMFVHVKVLMVDEIEEALAFIGQEAGA
ncbi:MAG: hypothetical protein ACFB51_17845 [Anaerolineae bacterium]